MECSWAGVTWVLVLLVQEAGGQLICYMGQHALLRNWKMQVSPLQDLEGLGLSLCGQRCRQQQDCQSYNYHRTSGRCQLLGLTSENSSHLLVSAEGWFHGNISSIGQAAKESCPCQPDMRCYMDPPSAIRCLLIPTNYTITIYTGDDPAYPGYSSSGAEVTIFWMGPFGKSRNVSFIPGSYNSVKSFNIDGRYLGPPTLMRVEMEDNNDGWFLNKTQLVNDYNGEVTEFPCYCWFDGNEVRNLQRDLTPA